MGERKNQGPRTFAGNAGAEGGGSKLRYTGRGWYGSQLGVKTMYIWGKGTPFWVLAN